MSPNQSRIPTIRYWSRRLAWLLMLCLFALPALVIGSLALSWLHGMELQIWSGAPRALSSMEPADALFTAGVTSIAILAYLLPLHHLHRLFSLWGRGEILTRSAALAIKNVGMWLAGASVFVGLVLPSMALAYSTWLGRDVTWFDFSIELDIVLVGGAILVVGMVLDEAARVAEEAELTI